VCMQTCHGSVPGVRGKCAPRDAELPTATFRFEVPAANEYQLLISAPRDDYQVTGLERWNGYGLAPEVTVTVVHTASSGNNEQTTTVHTIDQTTSDPVARCSCLNKHLQLSLLLDPSMLHRVEARLCVRSDIMSLGCPLSYCKHC
jgi:hypothetical protein